LTVTDDCQNVTLFYVLQLFLRSIHSNYTAVNNVRSSCYLCRTDSLQFVGKV